MEIFGENCNYQMHAYEGIGELLAFGQGKGDEAGCGLQQAPCPGREDRGVCGSERTSLTRWSESGKEIPKKPDPRGALEAAKEMGVAPENCLYFGDTNTDMETGRNAGMDTVGVLWGFRGREELAAFAPAYLIESPWDMIRILSGKAEENH